MQFLSADKIFDGRSFLPAGSVLVVNNGRLQDIVPAGRVDASNVQQLRGIVTPGFVNSHCHLELSHMLGMIPEHTGLPGFARHIIISRNKAGKEEQAERMQQADKDMWNAGIVAVGDISNGNDSFATKQNSPVFYHTFLELIGLNPVNAHGVFEKGLELFEHLKQHRLAGSLAPHAPYSTSRQLIASIARFDEQQQLPLAIHNQESDEETKFFEGVPSGFNELYAFLGLDLSWFKAPGHNSLQHYADLLPATPSLLVHNTVSRAEDLELVAGKPVYWCFCPNANLYIENRLPDYKLFKQQVNNLCLGTDSLASNHQLDLVKEAEVILAQAANVFSLEDMLAMMTLNGAKALGIAANYGQLHVGKNAGLNLVEADDKHIRFIKKLL